MATEVTLPALGESVTEGTVTRWLKQVGDSVSVDEALLEVSTDKVDTEIPSPVAGTLLEIKAAEDETVEVGAVLALVGEADESTDGQTDGPTKGGGAADEADTQAEAAAEAGTPTEEPAAEAAAEQTQEQQPQQPEQPSAPERPAAQE